jgi:hypothetical protein
MMPVSKQEETPNERIIWMATAYQASRALYVAVELGLVDHLSDGDKSVQELAEAVDFNPAALARLLNMLAAFDILHRLENGRFTLTAAGDLLRSDANDGLRAVVLMYGSPNFSRTWDRLRYCVRTGKSAVSHIAGTEHPFELLAREPKFASLMSAGMNAIGAMIAETVLAHYDFSGANLIVDVGGGHGCILSAILQQYSHARGILFDLPHVIGGAGRPLAQAGVTDRCALNAGDMFSDLPQGADLYLLSQTLHDWEDDDAIAILRNCRKALAPNSVLLVIERVLPDRISATALVQSQLLCDLDTLVRTGGRERTQPEFQQIFRNAGLGFTRQIITGGLFCLIEAHGA